MGERAQVRSKLLRLPFIGLGVLACMPPVCAMGPGYTGVTDAERAREAALHQLMIHPSANGEHALATNIHAGMTSRIASHGQTLSGPWGAPFWEVDLALIGWGRAEGVEHPWLPQEALPNGPELLWIGRDMTVQYLNDEHGLRQNFLLFAPPGGEGRLRLTLLATGDLAPTLAGHDGLRFVDDRGATHLLYRDLRVYDACGDPLPGRFVLRNIDCDHIITIEVDDSGATYPLLIDPVATTPSRQLIGTQFNGQFGFAVSGAGDLNGDGYSDLAVGGPYMSQGESNEGLVFIYYGGPNGIGAVANVVLQSNVAEANLGFSIAHAGDLNGDGYSDLLVGAPNWENSASTLDEGAVFVYYGSPTGIGTTPDIILQPNSATKYMGYDVAGLGDINGDGYSDIITGGWLANYGQSNEGAAWVFLGAATGLTNTPAHRLERNQTGAQFAQAVAGPGDINGDGYDDVVVGAYRFDIDLVDDGAIFVYFGGPGASPLGAGPVAQPLNPPPAQTFNTAGISRHCGWAVSAAGDVNGDGYADLIQGDWRDDIGGPAREGTAMVYHGSATGLITTPAVIMQGNVDNVWMGRSVAFAGDVNGDGYADVLIGIEQWTETLSIQGAAHLHLGGPGGIQPTPFIRYFGNFAGATMGRKLKGAGDLNGDGYSDIVVGQKVHLYNGSADIFLGGTYLITPAPNMPTTPPQTLHPSALADAHAGWSVANAGDVNGDGFSDVLAGAPDASNGQPGEGLAFLYLGQSSGLPLLPTSTLEVNMANAAFGTSVATAGDVNGDGYADVVIGAPEASGTGRVYVFHGGAAGIAPVPAVVLSGTPGSRFGHAVSTAGDINSDGYADLLVGAPDAGHVQVYLGTPFGLDPVAHEVLVSAQPGDGFGWSVATAGDVNGDGFSDIIIGAPFHTATQTAEGSAFVYLGSSNGLVVPHLVQLSRGQAHARFGISVSGAGDTNGDGYHDMIVGADRWEQGQTDEGGAFVYYGSPTGMPMGAPTVLQPNVVNAGFGASVAEGGDINGDGYADVLVGAPFHPLPQAQSGRVFVFAGRPIGVATSNSEHHSPAAANWRLGHAVAGGGDVDGDGFSDVIAGAPYASGGLPENGALVMVRGNRSPSLSRPTRQYLADLTSPLSTNSFDTSDPMHFGIGHWARSPLGRMPGRLHWEVVFEGDAFSGSPITNSVASTAFDPAWTDLGLNGTELKHLVLKAVGHLRYKWRCRVEYPLLRAYDGQRYSRWFYGFASGHGDIGVLPLELMRFSGRPMGTDNLLEWTTASERGTDRFDMERSQDGRSFLTIGAVPAAGQSTSPRDYAYLDRSPPAGVAFYRLRMVDSDGAQAYSPTVAIDRTENTVRIWPNPVLDELRWSTGTAEAARVVVIDGTGRHVIDRRVSGGGLSGSAIAQLAPGHYILLLYDADGAPMGRTRFQKVQAPIVR